MRKLRTLSLLCAIVLAVSLVMGGCNAGTPQTSESTQTSAGNSATVSTEPSEAAGEIVIGYVGPMTGNSASMGLATDQGIQLAVKEINANGGIMGHTIKYVSRDDASDPTTSKTMVEELIDKEKVTMMVGQPNSTCVQAAEEYVNENKVIQIINIATNTALTDPETFPYSFRTFFPSPVQADALANMAKENGFQKIVLLGDNSALGNDGIAAMQAALEKAGVEYVEAIQYTSGDADLTPVAEKIKADGADCALAWTLGADAAKIVAALSRIGYMDNLVYLGYTGLTLPNFRELAGDGVDRCYTLNGAWSVEAGATELDPVRQALYDKMVAEYGAYDANGTGRSTNSWMIASGYDAIYLYKWAVETAGTFDPDVVKETLETKISEYQAVGQTDTYKFSATSHEAIVGTDLMPVLLDQMATSDMLFGDIYVRGSLNN